MSIDLNTLGPIISRRVIIPLLEETLDTIRFISGQGELISIEQS